MLLRFMKYSRCSQLCQVIASLIACILSFSSRSIAQEEKSVKSAKRTDYKNSIKLNLTSPILYNSAFLFGYERVLKNNQSINISGGYMEFPVSLSVPEYLHLDEQKSKSGYNVVVDYRFYLSRENRYPAPQGVYLAPFIALHHFESDRDFIYTDSNGMAKNGSVANKINFFTIGGQLGYQFVIKRRFVIDAVLLGPGISQYKFDVKLNGNLTDAEKESITAKIIEALKDKVPLLDELATDKEASGSGVEAFWSVGFRYNISIGFRF